MKAEIFKKMYPNAEEGEITPEEFHQPLKYTKPGDISNDDINFWEGFDAAVNMFENILHGLNFTKHYSPSDVIDLLEEEIENFKKDA